MITTKGSSASTTAARVYGARPMDFSLTDEQQLIRETAREFAHKVVRPRADENARKHHFDVNRAKMWISMGNYAQVALIFAQTDPEKKHRGLACFLVDTDQEGFQPTEIHGKMGLHGSDTAAIGLDDVFAGDDQVLGEVGDGFKVAMSALDSGRFSVAAGSTGICQYVLDESVRYATERKQFDRPIAAFQLVQGMLAEMKVKTDAARLLTWRAGWLKDQGAPNTTETSIAKFCATEPAQRRANTRLQV